MAGEPPPTSQPIEVEGSVRGRCRRRQHDAAGVDRAFRFIQAAVGEVQIERQVAAACGGGIPRQLGREVGEVAPAREREPAAFEAQDPVQVCGRSRPPSNRIATLAVRPRRSGRKTNANRFHSSPERRTDARRICSRNGSAEPVGSGSRKVPPSTSMRPSRQRSSRWTRASAGVWLEPAPAERVPARRRHGKCPATPGRPAADRYPARPGRCAPLPGGRRACFSRHRIRRSARAPATARGNSPARPARHCGRPPPDRTSPSAHRAG